MGIGPSPKLCMGSTLRGNKSHPTEASKDFTIAI